MERKMAEVPSIKCKIKMVMLTMQPKKKKKLQY